MRRRTAVLLISALSLLVALPAGAAPVSDDDGKVCVRSALILGEGREVCVVWEEIVDGR